MDVATPLWTPEDPQTISISLDPNVYSSHAALKAAHEMSGSYAVRVSTEADRLTVTLQARTGIIDPQVAASDLLTRVADYRLREILDQETRATRDVILAHALSRTSLKSE
jgi:His-Xaa-Ser system protein HxsD